MSIGIKELALDVFIMYHPKVMEYKKKSKKLHKELKPRGVSLMQCQDMVIKGVGFNNWHHFISILKKDYTIELREQLFKITPTPLLDGDYVLMGHDINFNHYKWSDRNQIRSHQIVIGQEIYKDYDLFMMSQNLKRGRQVNVINPGNRADLDRVINIVKRDGREKDLRVFNLSSDMEGGYGYKHYFNSVFESCSKGYIISLYSVLKELNLIEDMWFGRFMRLFEGVVGCLVELRDKGRVVLDLDLIESSLHFEKLFLLMRDNRVSLDNRLLLVEYFKHLPGFTNIMGYNVDYSDLNRVMDIVVFSDDDITINGIKIPGTILEHHGYIHLQNTAMKKLLGEKNVFSPHGIQISRILTDREVDNQYVNVFYFGDIDDESTKFAKAFVVHMYKVNISNLLGGSISDVELSDYKSQDRRYIYMRDMTINNNISVFAAQGRSCGIAFCFSYESLTRMKAINPPHNVLMLAANTTTKIMSNAEKDSVIEEWGLLLHGTPPTITEKLVGLNVFTESNISGDFWMTKNGSLYQMKYKNIKMAD